MDLAVIALIAIAVLFLVGSMIVRRVYGLSSGASQPAAGRLHWSFRIGLPVVVCLLGSLMLVRAVKRDVDIRSDFQSARLSAAEAELLLAQVREGGATQTEPIPVTVPRETKENLPPAEPQLAALTPIEPPARNVTIFDPGATEGKQVATLPDWASGNDSADSLPQVIQSKPNVTTEQAEAEAVELLSRRLAEDFGEKHPEAAGWNPPAEFLKSSGVIGRKAVQESELTIGQFTEPVFQAFLEVAPPEDFDAQLFNAWRADTVQFRLLLVGGAMGLLTLMFGSLAGYFRIDEATRGKYRKQLRWGTAALWVAAGSALAFVA